MRQGKCLQSLGREPMTYQELEVRLEGKQGKEGEMKKTMIKKCGEKRREKKGEEKGITQE